MSEAPIRLDVSDDLSRSRLTVFFRFLLAIPHYIWFVVWSVAVVVVGIVGWVIALATGRLPDGLHRFFSAYLRYMVQLTAYLTLVANPYPPFDGKEGAYPIDVHFPAPERQSRWRTLFRLFLALPALLLSAAFGAFVLQGRTEGSSEASAGSTAVGILATVALLGWFASLVTGRMPRGLRDAGAYAAGYRAQALAYLLLVTERYPNSDPTAMLEGLTPPPEHPVRVVGDPHDLRRSRVTVLFRLPLAIPLVIWLLLWTVAVVFVVFAQWFVTLFRGRPAAPLHRFLVRYVRYGFHVSAFLFIVANPFPAFTGAPDLYPLDVELPEAGRQNRWKTGFRLLLAIPAGIFNSALGAALGIAAVLTWFYALATGSAPWGLRNLMAYAIRYQAQASSYVLLLTDRYPHASPLEGAAPAAEEPFVADPPADAPLLAT